MFEKIREWLNNYQEEKWGAPLLEITFADGEVREHRPDRLTRVDLHRDWTDWVKDEVLDKRYPLANIKEVTVKEWQCVTIRIADGSFKNPNMGWFMNSYDYLEEITEDFTKPIGYKKIK